VAELDPGFGEIYRQLQGYDPSEIDDEISRAISESLGGSVSFDVRTGAPTIERTNINRSAFTRGPQMSPEFTQQYFRDGVAAPLLRAYDEQVAPRISAAFAGQGAAFSTRRGLEQTKQLDNLNQTLTGALSNAVRQDQQAQFQSDAQFAQQQNQLNYGYDNAQAGLDQQFGQFNAQLAANADNWQQQLQAQLADNARGRQQQAVAQAQQFAMQPFARAQAMQQLLAPQQQNAQMMAQARYNEFLRTRPENSPWTQQALAFASQQYQQQYMQQNNSQLGQIAGIGGALIGGVAGGITGGPGGIVSGAGIGSSIGGSLGGLAGGTTSPINAGIGLVGAAQGMQGFGSTSGPQQQSFQQQYPFVAAPRP